MPVTAQVMGRAGNDTPPVHHGPAWYTSTHLRCKLESFLRSHWSMTHAMRYCCRMACLVRQILSWMARCLDLVTALACAMTNCSSSARKRDRMATATACTNTKCRQLSNVHNNFFYYFPHHFDYYCPFVNIA